MNANAKKWVAALRSGKYEQIQGQLAKNGGFCCLGVACEVAVAEGVIEEYDDAWVELPAEVREWLELVEPSGSYADTSLVDDNDTAKLPFDEIADIIEAEPAGLFFT